MAAGVPPPPLNSPSGSYYWLEWYTNLTNFLNGTNIPWTNLNFTGSKLTDIQTRLHNTLQGLQGGIGTGAGNVWHVTGRGYIDATGLSTGFPTGWTASHPSTGVYILTHNLGINAPAMCAVATSATSGVQVSYMDLTNVNQITVILTNLNGSASLDGAFSMIVST